MTFKEIYSLLNSTMQPATRKYPLITTVGMSCSVPKKTCWTESSFSQHVQLQLTVSIPQQHNQRILEWLQHQEDKTMMPHKAQINGDCWISWTAISPQYRLILSGTYRRRPTPHLMSVKICRNSISVFKESTYFWPGCDIPCWLSSGNAWEDVNTSCLALTERQI